MIEKQSHHTTPAPTSESDIHHLFAQLPAHEIEQFYAAFQLYTQQQRLQEIEAKIAQTKQRIADNERQMQAIAPSPIALSELVQLQVCGVEDIDLLDRMLARGDEWLDHTMQLLHRCEQLNMIEEGYTHWCEHALDGAYEWIASMQDSPLPTAPSESTNQPENITEPTDTSLTETDNAEIATEDQLLRKLMSEDGEEEIGDDKISFTIQQPTQAKITRPLPKITQPLVVEADTDTDDEIEDQWSYTYPDANTATKIKITEQDQDQDQAEEQKVEATETAEEDGSVAEASAQPRQQTTFKLRGRWRRSLAKILRR